MSTTQITPRWLLLAAALLTAGGCGGSSARVSGEATYDGQPLQDGYVTVLPADGNGVAVGGKITGGRYHVDGLTPGSKLVKVEAVKEAATALSSEDMARLSSANAPKGNTTGIIDPTDIVPPDAEGNNRTVEITAGDHVLDLHLTKPAHK